jgi:hypothetical protein
MKSKFPIGSIVGALTALALAAGCAASRPQTESLLSEAGFKSRIATTPAQQEQLRTLPPQRLSVVSRKGQTYFVYPDTDQNLLYFGKEAQYKAYQQLRASNSLREEKLETAETNADADAGWAAWGGMGPWAGW